MKRLFLLRHAKSDWGASSSSDHERPLAERGRRAAHLVGRFLSTLGQVPERVVSSSAVRARTTAELASEAGGWKTEVELRPQLYQASPTTLLDLVRDLPDEIDSILLVGHEPIWSETAGLLIGSAEVKMVTAALARVDFPVDSWRTVAFGGGVLAWLVTPKLLAAGQARS